MDSLVCIFRAVSAIVNAKQVVGVPNWENSVSAFLSMVVVGCLSVAVLDLWQRLAHRLGGLPPTNWAVVGRWLLMLLRQGILFNTELAQAPPLPRERLIGWVFHYIIGVVYVWYNVNPGGSYNDLHDHPGADLAAIFYIKVPRKSGNLVLMDPFTYKECKLNAAITPLESIRSYGFTPTEGKFIMFPGHLLHRVETNRTKEDRISIAFNINIIRL